MSWPKSGSVGELALPIVCYAMASMREKSSSFSFALTTCSRKENWPRVIKAGKLSLPPTSCSTQSIGPATHLGSTEELILMVGTQVN